MWINASYSSSGERIPPNNWVSNFHGSAWQWNEERQQYYYHQYVVKQPDLNYRNPVVVEEMKDVLKFWLDKGVDGFQVDAINTLFEDSRLQDEPPSGDPEAEPGDPDSLLHVYTRNQPETYEMVQQWRQMLDEIHQEQGGDTRVMMIEAYATFEQTMNFYGNESHPGAHFPFNFFFISDLNNTSTASDFRDIINLWMDHMTTGRWPNWVNGNHDRHRVATRYGSELADGMNMLALLLPGVGVTYNGDEIGMVDAHISWEDTQDPAGLNAGPDRYELFSRDPERTPFQWDNSTSAGFSSNPETWLPINENYNELNLENQKLAEKSHYKVYKKLIEARKSPTLQKGSVETVAISEGVLAFIRDIMSTKQIRIGPKDSFVLTESQ
ncbi:Maltase 2 [Blattella germanica]|nr:Maltase 2 [Blattella germanica]